jgi:hypothetical protein
MMGCTVKSLFGSSLLIATMTFSLLLLHASQSPAGSTQPVAPQTDIQTDPSMPIYTPPKKLTPRARVGGQLRGTEGSDPEIQALVPDHVGLTINQTPVLNWFLSKPTAYTVRFTLVDNRSIQPVHEAPLPSPKQAGIQTINLKELGLRLEPDVQYRWYVSVVRNPDSPSQDIVAGGVIERCEFNACLVEASPHLACSTQSVQDNARQGFWYDAMACLCTLIDARPTDAPLRRMRAALLKQVGLHGVAEWDLRSLTTPTR